MRPLRIAVTGSLLLALLLVPQGATRAQGSPSASVFQVVVMAHDVQGPYRSEYHSVISGTAFFVAPDGTALTNSHNVYPVRENKITYQLLAIVGKEFYGANLICASTLPEDPKKPNHRGTILSRDIAEIRLTPPHFTFDQLTYNNIPFARAHMGSLPSFPALPLGADPAVGDAVRVLGFGHLANSPVPYEWSAQGSVKDLGAAQDGTPLFKIAFAREAEPGHSGSPVLNLQDQVVGIIAWVDTSDHTLGTAISRSALDPACSSPSAAQAPKSLPPAPAAVPSLGSVEVTDALTAHGVESRRPRDEATEFKLGDNVYAYIKLRIPRVASGNAARMIPVLWRWTAPSGETLERDGHWVLQEGWTELYAWDRLPPFVGKVQQPLGTWHVEVLVEDVLVAKIEFTLAP